MSRRKSAVKRTILPDARYDSQTVSKFINVLMYQGKKSTASGSSTPRWISWRTARASRA